MTYNIFVSTYIRKHYNRYDKILMGRHFPLLEKRSNMMRR